MCWRWRFPASAPYAIRSSMNLPDERVIAGRMPGRFEHLASSSPTPVSKHSAFVKKAAFKLSGAKPLGQFDRMVGDQMTKDQVAYSKQLAALNRSHAYCCRYV